MLAEVLNFQGAKPILGMGSLSYFITGERNTHFLGCDVVKQHHTLTQIIMGLLNNGFELKVVEEAEPPKEMMDIPGMEDELRRPMMLLVKAIAKK